MNILIDYRQDLMTFHDKRIPLETFRKFLLHRWPHLAAQYRIGSVSVDGRLQQSHDWATIFTMAQEYGAPVQEFLLTQAAIEQLT